MPSWKFKRRKKALHAVPAILKETIPATLKETLRLVKESSDVLPPLKSAASGLYRLTELIDAMKGNKEEAERLASFVNRVFDLLEETILDPSDIPSNQLLALDSLSRELDEIAQKASTIPKGRLFTRFVTTEKEKDKLRVLQAQLDSAMNRYQLASFIRIECTISSKAASFEEKLSSISSKADDSSLRLQALQVFISNLDTEFSTTRNVMIFSLFELIV